MVIAALCVVCVQLMKQARYIESPAEFPKVRIYTERQHVCDKVWTTASYFDESIMF